MSPPHLSDETLLLLHSGELTDDREDAAVKHLASCEPCKVRFEGASTLLSNLGRAASETDRKRFERRLTTLHRRHRWDLGQFVKPAGAFASATAAVLVTVLIWNTAQPIVSAEALVTRAVQQEEREPEQELYVRISDGRGTCTANEAACNRIRSKLKAANWSSDRPLSARSFAIWRASLTKKTDAVTSTDLSLSLRTETKEGRLHAATLRVRKSDYHAVEATLEFDGSDSIAIVEEKPRETVAASSDASLVKSTPRSAAPPVEPAEPAATIPADRLDQAEIDVRTALHKLDADAGYETSVERTKRAVNVFGLVRNERRRTELAEALMGIVGVQLTLRTYADFQPGDDSRFPTGETGNTEPPLAAAWLKSAYPDPADRLSYVDRLTRLSTRIVGEAASLTQLQQSTVADSLSTIRTDHEKAIAALLSTLAKELEPLAGGLGNPPTNVPMPDAKTLDSAVTRLFFASRADAGTLDDEVANIRGILEGAQ